MASMLVTVNVNKAFDRLSVALDEEAALVVQPFGNLRHVRKRNLTNSIGVSDFSILYSRSLMYIIF